MERSWSTVAQDFYAATAKQPPWPIVTKAAELLGRPGRALEIGPGAGRDTRFLLERGFEVTAVDPEPQAAELLRSLADVTRLQVVTTAIEEFEFGHYDLVTAMFSLPFIEKAKFPGVWTRLKGSLQPGGLVAGTLFGVNDEWNRPGGAPPTAGEMTFLTAAQVHELLSDLETLEFEEEDEDGQTALGTPKHWHVFHVIARRD